MTNAMDSTCNKMYTTLVCFAILISIVIRCSAEDVCDVNTFRKSSLYSNLKPEETYLREVKVVSMLACARNCYDDVTCKAFLFSRDVMLCYLCNTRLYSLSFEPHSAIQAYEPVTSLQSDCYEAMMNGESASGVYSVVPRDNDSPIDVFCEITSTTESWLVIQRRTDGSEDFYRTWNEYRDGFGYLNNEFWLGNTNIHRLTSQGHYDLRIDMEDFQGNTSYALYKSFSLATEKNYFQLSIGEYSWNAGDSLRIHNGYNFSTHDRDLDVNHVNCAEKCTGAWWYVKCHMSNLNGRYMGRIQSYATGITWRTWGGQNYSLKSTVMKIRPYAETNIALY